MKTKYANIFLKKVKSKTLQTCIIDKNTKFILLRE